MGLFLLGVFAVGFGLGWFVRGGGRVDELSSQPRNPLDFIHRG